MAVVTAVMVCVAGGWVLAARPHRVLAAVTDPAGSAAGGSAAASLAAGGSLRSPLAAPPGSAADSAAGSAAGGGSATPQVVVDVVGKVRRPGVYRLPAGSRVADAVTAAGGLQGRVDPVTVNLARKLLIGLGPAVGAVAAGSPAGPGAAAPSGGSPLDLNSATVDQLDGLPGVGPVLAQRIADWRTQHGRFDSVDQLRGVSGIGDSKYADLKALVTVG